MEHQQQLNFDFTESTTQRDRAAVRQREQIALFPTWVPNLDVSVYSATEAVVHVSASGEDLDRAHDWITGLAGSARPLNRRRFAIPIASLDRFAWPRPPAKISLDGNARAVASAIHADKLGLKPLKVRKHRRLIAESPRGWPSGMRARDVGWPAILALTHMGIDLDIDESAQEMMLRKLASSGNHIATATLGGSAVYLKASRPALLERMELPALSHVGEPASGDYRMPLLCAAPLLEEPAIRVPGDVAAAIRRAAKPAKPLIAGEGFPWTLWDFQSTDAGEGMKILDNTGSVLFAGDMGSGKMEWVDNTLWTPTGRLRIGDAEVGDQVYGSDGRAHTITGVFPQGVKQLYRVTFSDGASLRVGAEHLWAVHDGEGPDTRTVTTMDLTPGVDHIPLAAPMTTEDHGDGPALGFLIGALGAAGPEAYEGGSTEMMLRILKDMYTAGLVPVPYPEGETRSLVAEYAEVAAEILSEPLLLGLDVRLAAMEGMAASMGEWGRRGLRMTGAVSDAARALTQSLGGTCTDTPGGALVTLPRDVALRCGAPRSYLPTTPTRAVVSVEPDGEGEAVCISVDAEDQLYVSEHGIVTHNTTVSLAVAHEKNLFPLLVVAPLSAFSTWERQLGEMGRSCYMAVGSAKKNWEEMEAGNYDAYLVSYDRLATFDELLRTKHLKAIIADELQRIRNAGSRRSRALRGLATAVPYRIGLSGTPFVNGVQDLLSQGAFLAPSDWPARASTKTLADMYPGDPVESVTEQLHAIMVRRRMDQVGKKLAKREDLRVYVNLTQEQTKAMADLEEECRQAKEAGEFDGGKGKMNALVKLGQMRKITSCPSSAGVGGPNPKVEAAVRILKEFKAEGRKVVVFADDRPSLAELCDRLTEEGFTWGRMWGSTSAEERIKVERDLHAGTLDAVCCTTQSSSESWTASPTATAVVHLAYQWQPSLSSQSIARVYRLNSDVNGPVIKAVRLHAVNPNGDPTVDDRMNEILGAKYELFARIVDRTAYEDPANDTSLGDLLYMLTGERDEVVDHLAEDSKRVGEEKRRQKEHAKQTIYKKKGK